ALLFSCRSSADSDQLEDPVEAVEEPGPDGTIYFIQRPADGTQNIMRTVLPDGEAEVVYTAPELSQLHEFDVFPDGNLLVFSQTPPPSVNSGIFDRNNLLTVDLTNRNALAEGLLGGEVPNDFFNMPIVSPDGRYLFYSRLGPDRLGITGTDTFYGIERYDLETGETLPIVPNSIWPQVSPDGSKVLFIILDLPTQQRGLGIVNSDGTEPELLINIGRYFDIDSPIFAPDGKSIYLSIVETQPEPVQSLLERILGVKVAFAHTEHNIPSTWWELELEGEETWPKPLNTEEAILINGRFHPGDRYMALSTTTGIQLLDLDNAENLSYESLAAGIDFGMLDWVGAGE
ncbi:MAG: hypothetical protein AAF485_07515, partial [Chloroflexota bacterium]